MLVKFRINGDPVEVNLKSGDRLVDVLREDLRLTGTKHGCGIGACGTCTVIVDGYPIASCLQLAAMCDGADIRTVEGLAESARLHPVQQAFVNKSALQCGICIPGPATSWPRAHCSRRIRILPTKRSAPALTASTHARGSVPETLCER
jgi:aerobic-type carbon monoxide dehydrogenase small subunit (CoxS/CutS family)